MDCLWPAVERECMSIEEHSLLVNSSIVMAFVQFSVVADYVCDNVDGNTEGFIFAY